MSCIIRTAKTSTKLMTYIRVTLTDGAILTAPTSSILTKDNVILQLTMRRVKNRTSFVNSFVACLERM